MGSHLLIWITALLAAGLGLCYWERCRLRSQVEEALTKLANGEPIDGGIPGDIGRLLRKVGGRFTALSREANDARFDLRALVAGMEDGVLVSDHKHIVTLVNPALLQIFSLKSEPIGLSVLSSLRLPILQTMIEGALQDGAAQQAEVELPGRGDPSFVVISAAPLRGAAGLPGTLVLVRDVTKLRRLEEMRREFVANVSHELRTPLSIFHGYLENLLETAEPSADEVQGSLSVMRKHSLRMNALVEDLLTLARLESGRDPIRPEPIEVAAFLDETLQDWRPKGDAKGVRMVMQVDAGLPEVPIDALKFHQVLANLLDNALKHTAAGGTITLAAVVADGSVEVSVADTGVGISREDLPHIFQRFYRADKARSRELGGTGLGLAIVKHIAQAHGGSVRAESERGKGTKVTLSFPATVCLVPQPAQRVA